ncbi:hypothetical protein IW262DRAFT_1299593 [Armillaria fumosa]|nr:hypothetical protein IW262DRAFT_1299593 [Armillaria fumosa]
MTIMSSRDVPLSFPVIDCMVTMDDAIALLHVIKQYEAGCTVTELVDSYTSGNHPYFQYQTSMIDLVSNVGHVFYSSMLQCLLEYERSHPGIVKSDSFPPSPISVFVRNPTAVLPSRLPHELLEHIFRFMPKPQLLVARRVCQSWCLSASRISHRTVLLCLRTDWQNCVGSCVHEKEEVEAYALLSQMALYIPPSSGYTDLDIAAWHEDCGITTYLRNSVSSPSEPTLSHLRIDFPDDMPNVLSNDTDINGTPPLLNQIFTPVGDTSCMESFLAGIEIYLLRLRMDNVRSLDLRMSRWVTYTFPCIVRTVGDTLHNLHLYYAPSTDVFDLHSFALDGFSELRSVQVFASLGDLALVLLPLSTWTSPAHGATTSELRLNVLMGHGQLPDALLDPVSEAIRSVLLCRVEGECRPFHGTFKVALVYSEVGPHIASGVDAFKSVLRSVGACEDIVAAICSGVEVIFSRDLTVSCISD